MVILEVETPAHILVFFPILLRALATPIILVVSLVSVVFDDKRLPVLPYSRFNIFRI